MRHQARQPEIQQEPVVHLLLEVPLGWKCSIRRPQGHPNQHTEAELKLIRDIRRCNPDLGIVELWRQLRQRGLYPTPRKFILSDA